MLRDPEFSSKAKVDRYGRKLPKDSGRKEMERLYRLDDDHGKDEIDDDEEVEKELRRAEERFRSTKDTGFSSSSEESSSEDEDEVDDQEANDVFGFSDQQEEGDDGVPKGEVSSRIAVVNLDWDNIRAVDLMAVFSSFSGGEERILKVSVYPSEFGKERMDKEEMEGPPKEIFGNGNARDGVEEEAASSDEASGEDDEDGEDEKIKKSLLKEDQGEEFDGAKLRRYQLERLRYYYAVLTCSSKSVAEAIYNALDGTEYLSTANLFDLRYIPDEMDFSNDKTRDECDRVPNGYKPNDFVTDALQHSKVRLTWDADDGTRREVQRKAFSGSRADIDENDLKAYLGSDSSEDEEQEPAILYSKSAPKPEDISNSALELAAPKLSKKDAERQRMRALLGLSDNPPLPKSSKTSSQAPVGDMQVTFTSGLTGSAPTKGSVFENSPELEETTVEKYIRKERERKAKRKERLKASLGTGVTGAGEPDLVDGRKAAEGEDEPPNGSVAEDQDLGFADPFFTAPEDDKIAKAALRKEQKRRKREQLAMSEADAAAQRAELELLMMSDDDEGRNTAGAALPDENRTEKKPRIQHFDMNALAKGEKALRNTKKSGKKRKMSEREKSAVAMKEADEFRVDVADPRFAAVFEKSEFAIDPSSSRFSGTEGMRRLLEEGRRVRGVGFGGESVEGEDGKGRGKGGRIGGDGDGDEVRRLVKKVKSKGR